MFSNVATCAQLWQRRFDSEVAVGEPAEEAAEVGTARNRLAEGADGLARAPDVLGCSLGLMHMSWSTGKRSQRSISGQGKPYCFMRGSQPWRVGAGGGRPTFLTLSHSEPQGRMLLFSSGRHTGANSEQRNSWGQPLAHLPTHLGVRVAVQLQQAVPGVALLQRLGQRLVLEQVGQAHGRVLHLVDQFKG